MMKKILLGALLVSAPMAVSAQDWESVSTTEAWAVTGFGADLRGVAFNPATGNVLVSDRSNNAVVVLSAADGSEIKTIANTETPDGTVSQFKIEASDDGQIFTQGFSGSVVRVGDESTTDASGSKVTVFQPATTGNSRALALTGSWADGTLVVVVARGGTISVATQDAGANDDTLTEVTTIASGLSPEITGLAISSDLTEIYAHEPGQSPVLFVGDGTPANGYSAAGSPITYSDMSFRYDIDIVENGRLMLGNSSNSGNGGETFSAVSNLSDGSALTGAFVILSGSVANNFAGAVDPDEAGGAMYIAAGDYVAKFEAGLSTNVADWSILD